MAAPNPGPPPPMPGPDPRDTGHPEDFPAWKAGAERWRRWAEAQDAYVESNMREGRDLSEIEDPANPGETSRNEKEHGQALFSLYGPQGMYTQQGGVDRNFAYDWANGVKKNIATRDSTAGWIPIEQWEWAENSKARNELARNPTQTYGQRLRKDRMGYDLQAGHLEQDPESGLYFNRGKTPDDPGSWEWFDSEYRKTKAPGGGGEGGAWNSFGGQGGGSPWGGSLAGLGGGGAFGQAGGLGGLLQLQALLDIQNSQSERAKREREYQGTEADRRFLRDLDRRILGYEVDEEPAESGQRDDIQLSPLERPTEIVDTSKGQRPGGGQKPDIQLDPMEMGPREVIDYDDQGNPVRGTLNDGGSGLWAGSVAEEPTPSGGGGLWAGPEGKGQPDIRVTGGTVDGPGQPAPTGTPQVKPQGTPSSNYRLSSRSVDPNDSQTFAMLGAPISRAMAQQDQLQEYIKRNLPRGGARDQALAQAANQRYGVPQQFIQAQLADAIGRTAERSNAPLARPPLQNSGTAQAMLGADTQRYGVDVGARTAEKGFSNQRAIAELQDATQRYGLGNQYTLGMAGLGNQMDIARLSHELGLAGLGNSWNIANLQDQTTRTGQQLGHTLGTSQLDLQNRQFQEMIRQWNKQNKDKKWWEKGLEFIGGNVRGAAGMLPFL